MKKPIRHGEDFVRDEDWRPIVGDRNRALSIGRRRMPEDLKALGFGVAVFDAGDYFRISFGRKS